MQPISPQYRTLDIPHPRGLSDGDARLVDQFNRRFSTDDIYLEQHDTGVRVHLNRLDIDEAQAAVREISGPHNGSDKARNLLTDSLDAILAIKSYGLDGRKRNYVGYNRERKVRDRAAKELRRGRHYYANDAEFSSEINPIPAEFVDRIIQGDSAQVLTQLPDNCVDLVFTSPPYNFGLDYEQSPDDYAWESYFNELFVIFDQCIRVLKPGGRIAVNVQPLFSDYIPSHHVISNHFMKRKLIWKGEILWEKNNYNCKYTAWGSWKSPSSPYLKYTWEFIEIFCKASLKMQGRGTDADIDAEEFKSWVNAKWSIAPERNMAHYGHPAMFPEELATRILKLFSFKGAFILDPFAGVGTTPLAAKKHNRHYLGIDISEDYCKTARERLNDVTSGIKHHSAIASV